MSLSAAINNAVKSAFDAVGDLKESFDFVSQGDQVYDPTTGQYTTDDVTDTVQGVKYDFEAREVDGEVVKRGDAKIIVQQSEFTETYRNYDHVNQGSKKWDIVSDMTVPGDSVAIFHVRLQNG